MKRTVVPLAAALLAALLNGPLRADSPTDATAVLDRAIQAMGGADRLGKMASYNLKSKGTISIGGAENAFTSQSTVRGIDHCRAEFEADIGGNKVHAVTVLAGDKA